MKTEYGKNERLQYLIDEYKAAESKIKEINDYKKQISDLIIKEFSSVDPCSDFEGTENIETDTDAVSLTWKITRKFSIPDLKFIAESHNIPLEQVSNVKYDYSAALLKRLPADIKAELELNALETKRASTGIKITNFADKKEN